VICALHVAVRVDTLIELGQEKSVVDAEALEKKILEALRAAKGPKTRPEIEDSVEGKTGRKRRALQRLVNAGNVVQEGSGTKGDPYKYKMLDPCSRIYVGTREQESQKGLEPRINTGEMLVPENSKKSFLVPDEKQAENGPGEEPFSPQLAPFGGPDGTDEERI